MRSLLHALTALAAAASLLACGGAGGGVIDGGPVGTGITTSVVGNVIDVSQASALATTATAASEADAIAALPPVVVSIDEVPGLESPIDAEGNFALDGDFAGAVTLRFATPGFSVTQPLEVPSGSVLVLADVELSPAGVEAQAGRQIGFVGRVVRADCAAALLLVADQHDASRQFRVALLPETSIERRDGGAASCTDIAARDRIAIDGAVRLDGVPGVTALRIVLAADPAPPDPVREVPFLGRVAAIDCARGAATLAGEAGRTRLAISAATTITLRDGTPLGCDQVRLGDVAAGLGRVTLRRPGVVAATSIVVTPAAEPGVEVRILGFLVAADCGRGLLELAEGDTLLVVRLVTATVIDPPLACEDLRPGDRIAGLARIVADDRRLVEAVRLRVRRPVRASAAGG